MKTSDNKIILSLDSDAEVSVKGFIAPIEYTQYNFHVDWDTLANLRVAEPEKQYPTSIFCDFLPQAAISIGVPWEIKHAGALELLKQLHPQTVVDVFRTPIIGRQDWTVVVIDATAFGNGGTLTIDIEIGREDGEAAFYLLDNDKELSAKEGLPKDKITWVWGEPGDTRQIKHRFDKGQFFKLGVIGAWVREELCINAFHAKISVVEK